MPKAGRNMSGVCDARRPGPNGNGRPGMARARRPDNSLALRTGAGRHAPVRAYAPLVQAHGGRVILRCQKPLARLLARSPGITPWSPKTMRRYRSTCHASLLSLPAIFQTRLDNIPQAGALRHRPTLSAVAHGTTNYRAERVPRRDCLAGKSKERPRSRSVDPPEQFRAAGRDFGRAAL